ncbi:acyl-CoA dehydratase activase [Pseudobacteroides cellulosolvens]|uniref:CoA-substrate-specific enzyme activase n=1 Tax=Pseudobacteroides cellulosolvens ATCC 35603 = DSM 2933 TaxID=398512 RepID=A0A0L6JQP1_9FIRM|nr:acyl-CoA dehydratase activase [Pseudobacteroides cellulosolvens]KNY28103.1 CoA-substrate-specific enzyme activase [Pseudobacteroides cellulosolvens ATCC 35603 = DSM 2933]
MKEVYIGIDIGSVSTNIIIIDKNFNVVFDYYARSNGQPLNSVKVGLTELKSKVNEDIKVRGIGTTGSGRQLIGAMIGADVVKNEITAHAAATLHYVPDVRTIFEIGGQDSKIIILKDQVVVDFSMNTVCAAGTGSFLDHQSERLKVPIEEFGDLALTAQKNVRIAGRCTVFAESDMVAKQQFGFSKAEIINGLCEALVRNYINNLGRGKVLVPPFVFQGGVAANKGIRAAFEKEVGHKVIVPKYFNVMGAIGVAILAKEHVEQTGEPTEFKGFDVIELDYVPSSFECNDCSNFCEVIKVEIDGKIIAALGDKCGKWTNSCNPSKRTQRKVSAVKSTE